MICINNMHLNYLPNSSRQTVWYGLICRRTRILFISYLSSLPHWDVGFKEP